MKNDKNNTSCRDKVKERSPTTYLAKGVIALAFEILGLHQRVSGG